MSDWVYGFFMAWGMFLALPCPFRRWRESARGKMLACLPLVGAVVGGVWILGAWLLAGAPLGVRALVLAAVPWLCTGFLHLDGFMDVCDAVLSRRDLATRQKILKDSNCGAFAVISIVLLVLTQWSLFFSAGAIHWLPLLLIPVASRASAGIAVLCLRPMGSSQYAAMEGKKTGYVWWLAGLSLLSVALPLAATGSFAPLAAAVGYWLAAYYGYRQLNGMSGDISGFALTLGELAGVAVLTLAR